MTGDSIRGDHAAEETRLLELFDRLPIAVIIVRPEDGTILWVNEHDLGLSHASHHEDVVGTRLTDYLQQPDDLPRVAENIRVVMESGNRVQGSAYRTLTVDGEPRDVNVFAMPFTFDHAPALLCVVDDITDLVATQEALRFSEERFRSLYQTLPTGVHLYRLEADDRLVFEGANLAADRILGIEHVPLLGLTLEEAFPGNVGLETPRIYREVARDGGQRFLGEIDYDANGITGVFEVEVFQTQPRRIAVGFVDVTEQRRAERERKASDERFRLLFETTPQGVMVWRLEEGDLRLAEMNEAATSVFCPEYELMDIGMSTFAEGADQLDRVERYLDIATNGGSAHWDAVVPFLPTAEGVEVRVSITAYQSEPGVVVILFEDVTERLREQYELATYREGLEELVKERTAELEAANRDLAQATQAKSAFLASMSHELRTPLNSIIGFSSILDDGLAGPLADEQKRQVGMIRTSGRQLLALVSDLLDLAKIEQGHLGLDITEFSPADLITHAAETVRPLVEGTGLALVLDVHPSTPAMMRSDRVKVEEIVLNLLSNAIKYTSEGSIELGVTAADPDRVRLWVSDTGIGIAKSDQDLVFEEFHQIPRGTGGKPPGTGLGLSISRHLAQMLGGALWVQSTLGQGSCFFCELPLSAPRSGRDAAGASSIVETL